MRHHPGRLPHGCLHLRSALFRDSPLEDLLGNRSSILPLLLGLEPLSHISTALDLRDNKILRHTARGLLRFLHQCLIGQAFDEVFNLKDVHSLAPKRSV